MGFAKTKSSRIVGCLTRRSFLGTSCAAIASPHVGFAQQVPLPDRFLPQLVNTRRRDWMTGSVHVIPDDYFLYLMLDEGLAIRYGVGIGREGLYEAGTFTVARKAEWPWWRPTNAMIRREPEKYERYKNGLKGGPDNPLGARALYLYDDAGRDTFLRIHGTNEPHTIGSAASNGCARLTNEHVKDLYERVKVGAQVYLYPKGSRV